jgi:hypothetical protein
MDLQIDTKIADALAAYVAAAEEAWQKKRLLIAAFADFEPADRHSQVMTFYWHGPKNVLPPEALRMLIGVESDAEFRLIAKTFQPTSVEDCPECHRPMIVKFYRNGRPTRDICKECASVHDSEITKARHEAYVEQLAAQRERDEDEKAQLGKAIRAALLSAGPMTKTKLENSGRWFGLKFYYPHHFDEVFNSMVQAQVLVKDGATGNHRTIWKLDERYFHQAA